MLLQFTLYSLYFSTLLLSSPTPQGKDVHPLVAAGVKISAMKSGIDTIPKSNVVNKVVKVFTPKVGAQAIIKPIQKLISKPISAKLAPLKAASSKNSPSKLAIDSVKPNSNDTIISNNSGKVIRMLGHPVQGYQLKNGTFNHSAYSKAMKSLAKRQNYTQSKIKSSNSKKLKRRTTTSNNSSITFGSDLVNYPTPLLTTFGVGTPPQQIPFFLNMESSTTVVFSKDSKCSAGGGYDIFASSSVTEISPYTGSDIFLESPEESINQVAIKGTYISEKIIFSYKGLVQATLATLVYASTQYLSTQCYGQVGLAPYDTYSTYADESLSFLYTAVGGATSIISLYIGVVDPAKFPVTFDVEIMIGARDQSKFTGKMYQIVVSKSKSFYTNYPWKLEFGAMIVNGRNLKRFVGTVTFSLLHLGIHLSPEVVYPIYDAIGGSETYQPIGGPKVFTYPCRLNPRVSFTIPHTNIVLDIHPDDFNVGLHPQKPTLCIGAIQLPNESDGPVHTLGLVFLRSWYATYHENHDHSPNSIGLARAVRN